MKIVIPAAGKGTRLKELTENIPKPLIKVHDKPIIGHIIDSFDQLDYNEIIIIIGYRGEDIRNYVSETYPEKNIRFIWQESQLGLGHAIYQAKDHLNEPFIIFLSDIYVEIDYTNEWYEQYKQYSAAIGTFQVENTEKYGILIDNKIIEKPMLDPTGQNMAVVGLYIINDYRRFLQLIGHKVDNIVVTSEINVNYAFNNMFNLKYFPVTSWCDFGDYDVIKRFIYD